MNQQNEAELSKEIKTEVDTAEATEPPGETAAKQTEAEKIDPTKDPASELFDPLQALYADDLRISKKKPSVQFQNLAAFDTALKKQGVWGLQQKPTKPTAGGTKKVVVAEEKTARRFLAHQMPIKAPTDSKHHTKNLYKWLDQVEGPLKLLVKAMKTEQPVRVVVRNEHGVRGYMNGSVICFDRHWNLLLRDVIEIWTRRKFKYGVNKTCAADNPTQDCSAVLAELGIKLPELSVKSKNRKNVEITRKLAQLFIRGEQVVLVNILKN